MTRDRGDYQGIYEALFYGKDFRKLPERARHLLLTMRLTMGPTGIKAIPGFLGVYSELTGMPGEAVLTALQALTPGQWVEQDDNVYWVVRGLEFATGLEVGNRHHRKFVQRHVASLPRLPIVARFQEHYPEWIEGAVPSVPEEGSRSHPEPIAITRPTTETKQPGPGIIRAREALAYHVRCVVALNQAMAAHPSIGNRMREVSASEQQGVVSWEADGIPVEIAERVIRESTLRYRVTDRNTQPQSLKYFDRPVREAWERESSKAAALPSTPMFHTVT